MSVLDKVRQFLPKIAEANEKLLLGRSSASGSEEAVVIVPVAERPLILPFGPRLEDPEEGDQDKDSEGKREQEEQERIEKEDAEEGEEGREELDEGKEEGDEGGVVSDEADQSCGRHVCMEIGLGVVELRTPAALAAAEKALQDPTVQGPATEHVSRALSSPKHLLAVQRLEEGGGAPLLTAVETKRQRVTRDTKQPEESHSDQGNGDRGPGP